MKLKYYLRGMGIGIILTAIVMGFALGGRKSTLSDAEIITRAKALGMVEADSGVLTQSTGEVNKENENDTSASDPSLDKEGSEVSEEVQQEVALSGSSISEVAEEAETREESSSEVVSAVSTTELSSDSTSEASTREAKKDNDIAVAEATAVATSEATSEASEDASTKASTSEAKKDDSSSSANSTVSQANESSSEQATSNVNSKVVTIPGGLGSDQVAAILYREGLVDNAVTFNRYLIDRGMDRIIRSGTKTIPDGASYEQIASIITKG